MSDFEFRNPEQRAKKKPPVLKLSKKGLASVPIWAWIVVGAAAVSMTICGGIGATIWLNRNTSYSPSFDANDSVATSKWLASQIDVLDKTRRNGNKIATQNEFENINGEMAKHVGRTVRWKVVIDHIDMDNISFSERRLSEGDSRSPSVWFVITPVSGRDIPRELGSYEGREFGRAAIGKMISKTVATRLKTGQEVVISGTLSRFDLNGYSEVLFCNAIITNAEIHP